MLIILQLECAASVSFRGWVSEGGTPLGPPPRWEVIKNAHFFVEGNSGWTVSHHKRQEDAGAKGLVSCIRLKAFAQMFGRKLLSGE